MVQMWSSSKDLVSNTAGKKAGTEKEKSTLSNLPFVFFYSPYFSLVSYPLMLHSSLYFNLEAGFYKMVWVTAMFGLFTGSR